MAAETHERSIFGTDDPARIRAAVDTFCRRHLGAALERYEFAGTSGGSVHGVVLTDGRRVVVKGHRAVTSRAYLVALNGLKRNLADAGYPAPAPLAGPEPSGDGHLTVETMLPRGEPVDGHDPVVRRMLARGLAEFVARSGSHLDVFVAAPFPMLVADGALYPSPHSPRFDFAATARGAEWIDARARRARAELAANSAGAMVVVHGDWRTGNLAFAGRRLVGVFDWDSVHAEREPIAIAPAAVTFSVDWSQPGPRLSEARRGRRIRRGLRKRARCTVLIRRARAVARRHDRVARVRRALRALAG